MRYFTSSGESLDSLETELAISLEFAPAAIRPAILCKMVSSML